jgi:hypothetical protein
MVTRPNIHKGLGCEATSRNAPSRLPTPFGSQSSAERDAILENQEVFASEKTKSQYTDPGLASSAIDSPKSFGSLLTEVNYTNVISVNTSQRNSELLYFC